MPMRVRVRSDAIYAGRAVDSVRGLQFNSIVEGRGALGLTRNASGGWWVGGLNTVRSFRLFRSRFMGGRFESDVKKREVRGVRVFKCLQIGRGLDNVRPRYRRKEGKLGVGHVGCVLTCEDGR
jgi:hypothetical protein